MPLLGIFSITLFGFFFISLQTLYFLIITLVFYSWSQLYLWSGVVSSHSKRLKRVLPLAGTHTEYPCCCLNSFLLVKPVPLLCYQNFFSATESSSITPQMWGARRQISASPKFLHCLLQRAAAVLSLLLSKVELLEPKIGGEKPLPCSLRE